MTPGPAIAPTAFARPPRGEGRIALGVCAGLGRRWGVDAGLLRVIAVFFGLTGVGLVAYLVLALVMPADRPAGETTLLGAAPVVEPWRENIGSALQSALTITVWAAVAVVAAAGAALAAVFGLAWVVGVAAAVLLLAAIAWRRPALAPLPLIAAALALPAAAVSLGKDHVQRTAGVLVAQPRTPLDVPSDGYRRGVGDVLLDLRGFRAAPRSVTRIKARSDLARVVVALPQDRCFSLRVHYRSLDGPRARATATTLHQLTNWQGLWNTGMGMSSRGVNSNALHLEAQAAQQQGQYVTSLFAFSRAYNQPEGQWNRVSADPAAPVLELDVAASSAIVVQDFRADVGPLDGYSGTWPNTVAPPAPPGIFRTAWSGLNHSAANVARWDRWAQESKQWAVDQARRFAGPCATRAELTSRMVHVPGQAAGTYVNGLGDRVVEKVAYGQMPDPNALYPLGQFDGPPQYRAPQLSAIERKALGLTNSARRQATGTAKASQR